MSIDPRLIERRKAVAEDRAQRNVGRLLKFLVILAFIAALVWLAFSPWFSVNQVRTAGIALSDANAILAERGVVAGTPMVMIRAASIEEELTADPWISDARVHVRWPDEVIVGVVERTPVAWVRTADGWARRSLDGAALPSAEAPDDTLPKVLLPNIADESASTSALVLGAVEFSDMLPDHLGPSSTIRVQGDELWASVDGYEVRLGRPVEMAVKATTLVAMLNERIPKDAVVVLIAPTHPAISPTSTTPMDGGSEGDTPRP